MGAENIMNPCKVPENFGEHVSLLGVFGEGNDDKDDEGAPETCGDLANMMSFIFEDDQCHTIQRNFYDDDDNSMRRKLSRSRRLNHGDDDDDMEMTMGMIFQLMAMNGCCGEYGQSRCDTGEFFNPCMEPERFLPDHFTDDNETMTCLDMASHMYMILGPNATCDTDFYGVPVRINVRGLYDQGCCGDTTTTEPTCEGNEGTDDDDHHYDDHHYDDDDHHYDDHDHYHCNDTAILGICEDMQFFDPDAPLPSPWNQTEENPGSCGSIMAMAMEAGINANFSCSDANPVWLADPNAQINNLMAYAGDKCCQGEPTTCVDDGSGMPLEGEGLYDDDDHHYDDDDHHYDDDDEGTGWKEGDWQPCVNSTDFVDGMVLSDNDNQMSCGTLAWSYASIGVGEGMECDAVIGENNFTYHQANWYMKNMGCCGNGPAKCAAENIMNPCKVPENFDEHVSLLGVFGEGNDDKDDEGAPETCGDLANMMSFIFEDDQCHTIQRNFYDDDDNSMRRKLSRSRRLNHGDDDDDMEMTVSMIFQLMAMNGCCGEYGQSRCDTGVIDMDGTRNQWTRECGYPKKPERRMHPNDMMTTVLAMDMNEDHFVGVVFGCMGDVPDAEYRVRVKMLEPSFFDKKRKDGRATKEDREKMIKKSVVTIAGSNLVAVQPDQLQEMLPGSAMERLNQFTHIFKANVPLNGMSNVHFYKDIRQARVEVQRHLPAHDGHDGLSKWLVDHCMKAASPGYILLMDRD